MASRQDTRSGSATPQVDLARIAFPTDRITLADLRQRHPNAFDTLDANFFDGAAGGRDTGEGPQDALADMIHIERSIARSVFDATLQGNTHTGVVASTAEDDRGFVEELSTHYARFGLAGGRQEAIRLIQSIESQASNQAQAHKGVSR